jgi:CRP-like cAMP-binding protein
MSRQDLAEMIGVRPETRARTIHRLQAEGTARFEGRKVTLRAGAAPPLGNGDSPEPPFP